MKHTTHTSEPNLIDAVHSDDYKSEVVRGKGYNHPGEVACTCTDTGNGFIAFFPRHTSAQQDYVVCMDYSQARDLVLALSHFQRALGFNAGAEPRVASASGNLLAINTVAESKGI